MKRTHHDDESANEERKRYMKIMLIFVAILFGAIILYKIIIGLIIKHAIASQSHVVEVSTMKVGESPWQPEIKAVGSSRAIRGVNVTTELAGMVQYIYFTPGSVVKKGEILVQLNIAPDVAQLQALQATETINLITYNRDKKQYAAKAISKEQLDTDLANWQNLHAQVAEQAATIAKKIIRAPFTGRLGISAVNPGQYLNAGDKVVTLQQLDPIYIDFYVPQQSLGDLKVGQKVTSSTDTFSNVKFIGPITTIEPLVGTDTRNVEVEATVSNTKLLLVPGMFVNVVVSTNQPKNYITLPQTAVSFNPYGNLVYIVQPDQTVKQTFVTTGETRGEQVQVLTGLKDGEEIVTTGQLKLKNGDKIKVNNSIVPSDSPHPALPNDH